MEKTTDGHIQKRYVVAEIRTHDMRFPIAAVVVTDTLGTAPPNKGGFFFFLFLAQEKVGQKILKIHRCKV